MHGINMVKGYSQNQDLFGDSSGEDERYVIFSVARESMGMQADMAGLGHQLELVVHTDSSAARKWKSTKIGNSATFGAAVHQAWAHAPCEDRHR